MTAEQAQQRYFSLLLEIKPGSDAIRALRAVLEIAGRRFQLRCVDVHEVLPAGKKDGGQ